MEKIVFDSGIQEYCINGKGVLRFNPGDPNVYGRYMEALDKVKTLEAELTQQAGAIAPEDGNAVIRLMQDADCRMKQLLGWIFGGDNDFDRILEGVNLLAVAGNGQRVVTNLFAALEPILIAGAERCAKEKTAQAVSRAKQRRAAQ